MARLPANRDEETGGPELGVRKQDKNASSGAGERKETSKPCVTRKSGSRDVFDRLASGASRSEERAYSGKELSRSRSSEGVVKLDLPSHQGRRWSGRIYSRMNIMDEEESNDVGDRFVKHVEAMLEDGGQKDARGGGEIESGAVNGRGQDQYIPPVPKIPDAFVGSIRRSEAVPARRMWNKF